MSRLRPYHALALLPPVALLVGVPLLNRVRPYIFGLPCLLAWILLCVLATSAVMALLGARDRAREKTSRSPDGPA